MEAWKHNSIATMIFSVDADTRAQLRAARKSRDLHEISGLTVYMHDTPEGVELSASPPMTTDLYGQAHGETNDVELETLDGRGSERSILSEEVDRRLAVDGSGSIETQVKAMTW